MNRRDFTKNAGLGILGLLLSPALQSCKKNYPPNPNPVLILGAGIAGLSAAYKLKAMNFTNIIVLEARNRIGGRVWTDRSLGMPADMGASWIHGPSRKNPIRKIADEVGASTYRTDDDSVQVYYQDGTEVSDTTLENYEARYDDLLEDSKERATETKSLRQAMEEVQANFLNDALLQYMATAYTEFDAGASLERLSSLGWDADEVFPGDDVLFPNGYDAIANHLAEGIDVRLNQIVTNIDYSATDTIVNTQNGGVFTAKHVICTLPLGVLKANSVQFNPALPSSKLGAINRLQMGSVNKILLVFPNTFWEVDTQYFGYCSAIKGQYPYFLNVKKFMNLNALMTFGFGDYGLALEGQTDAQIQTDIMAILRIMFGNNIPNPTNILVSRWTADPFAGGSYSFAALGSTRADFTEFETPVENKLFFAGEHTDGEYRGTVHGAFLSGEREAEKIYDLY